MTINFNPVVVQYCMRKSLSVYHLLIDMTLFHYTYLILNDSIYLYLAHILDFTFSRDASLNYRY